MREAFKVINRNLGHHLIGAEVGVRAGENALSILGTNIVKKLYLIDHYQPHLESSGVMVTSEQQLDFYSKMFQKLHPYVDKTVFVSMSSVFAATLFPDKFFDFVYIDASHTYRDVQDDMKAWLPKIKDFGILCGHDYNNKCTPEVFNAVNDFCKDLNLRVYNLGDLDWIIYK